MLAAAKATRYLRPNVPLACLSRCLLLPRRPWPVSSETLEVAQHRTQGATGSASLHGPWAPAALASILGLHAGPGQEAAGSGEAGTEPLEQARACKALLSAWGVAPEPGGDDEQLGQAPVGLSALARQQQQGREAEAGGGARDEVEPEQGLLGRGYVEAGSAQGVSGAGRRQRRERAAAASALHGTVVKLSPMEIRTFEVTLRQ
jgi:hypothetical protein